MKSKFLFLLCAIMIFVLIVEITDTYGLFESEKNVYVDNTIGKWNIYINDTDINKTQSFVIDSFVIDNDSIVETGKIAPGTTGYFDIVINPMDTQVSLMYDLTIDTDSLPSNIIIEQIEETTGRQLVRTGINTYSSIITLNDINDGVINNIRIYIKWISDEDNNLEDTEIGLTDDYYLEIPIEINVLQYQGEELVLYALEEE